MRHNQPSNLRGNTFHLTTLADLLSEPEEELRWLVEERLLVGGLSLLAAKPKVGKSTLARWLCLAVSRGERWLNTPTTQGTVFYLALEEKRSEVKRHFRTMGATPDDPIHFFIGQCPEDCLQKLRDEALKQRPALIVVDPLLKMVRVRDANDYAVVTRKLEPLIGLARDTWAHVLVTHHTGKAHRDGGDSILGSTAIFAAVDTAFIIKRTERFRVLSSIQRSGVDLEETVLHLDPESEIVTVGASRTEADEKQAAQAIFDYLQIQSEPVEEKDIHEAVEGRKGIKVKALRFLVDDEKVERTGQGKRGDPYLYSISSSQVTSMYRELENRRRKMALSDSGEKTYAGSHQILNLAHSANSRKPEIEDGWETVK